MNKKLLTLAEKLELSILPLEGDGWESGVFEEIDNEPGIIYLKEDATESTALHELVHAMQWRLGGYKETRLLEEDESLFDSLSSRMRKHIRSLYEPEDWLIEGEAYFLQDKLTEVMGYFRYHKL